MTAHSPECDQARAAYNQAEDTCPACQEACA